MRRLKKRVLLSLLLAAMVVFAVAAATVERPSGGILFVPYDGATVYLPTGEEFTLIPTNGYPNLQVNWGDGEMLESAPWGEWSITDSVVFYPILEVSFLAMPGDNAFEVSERVAVVTWFYRTR